MLMIHVSFCLWYREEVQKRATKHTPKLFIHQNDICFFSCLCHGVGLELLISHKRAKRHRPWWIHVTVPLQSRAFFWNNFTDFWRWRKRLPWFHFCFKSKQTYVTLFRLLTSTCQWQEPLDLKKGRSCQDAKLVFCYLNTPAWILLHR